MLSVCICKPFFWWIFILNIENFIMSIIHDLAEPDRILLKSLIEFFGYSIFRIGQVHFKILLRNTYFYSLIYRNIRRMFSLKSRIFLYDFIHKSIWIFQIYFRSGILKLLKANLWILVIPIVFIMFESLWIYVLCCRYLWFISHRYCAFFQILLLLFTKFFAIFLLSPKTVFSIPCFVAFFNLRFGIVFVLSGIFLS